MDGLPERRSLQASGQRAPLLDPKDDLIGSLMQDHIGPSLFQQGTKQSIVVRDHASRTSQHLPHIRIVLRQQREHLMTEPVAKVGGIEVRAVEAGCQPVKVTVSFDLGTCRVE